MISRKSALEIAEAYVLSFRKSNPNSSGYHVNTTALYDFLFEHDYTAWFCNLARQFKYPRSLKDFIMQIHTGESLVSATKKGLTWEERKKLGQQYLVDLAQDILNKNYSLALSRTLELDGYVYDQESSRLLAPEEDVLDVEHESGILESLITSLQLDNKTTILHHLKLSEEHYLDQKWDDSISNSRKYLESILQEVATAHSDRIKGSPLPKKVYGSPFQVRDFLQNEGLLEAKEKEALAKIYGLLSQTGGHPYMARNDQARLLRHLALTFSQFVMLRLQGSLAKVV